MALIKCQDCGQEISDQSAACIGCGRPVNAGSENSGPLQGVWGAVTRSKTPINLFALAMMACAAVLGVSATKVGDTCALIAFTYTLHTFLAVAGMFFVTLLFCRRGIYHPDDLARARRDGLPDMGQDKPLLAAALISLMFLAYGLYQLKQGVEGASSCG